MLSPGILRACLRVLSFCGIMLDVVVLVLGWVHRQNPGSVFSTTNPLIQ